jgi:hypothetical protein
VDYIYRKYDRGTVNYTIGYQPGAAGYPLSQIYVPAAQPYTDPVTGVSAPYYVVCATCSRPSGIGNITMTNPNYQVYQGLDITATKRYSDRWQMQAAITLQTNPQYFPEGSASFINPTGQEFQDGASTIPEWNVKLNGSYTLPYEINFSANYNGIQGASRTVTINGPGAVPGGLSATGASTTINQNTLEFQDRGSTRFGAVQLLDLGVQKGFRWGGSSRQIKLMFDAFNVFNANTVTTYSGNNSSLATFTQPTVIIAPRVFRLGTRITF